MAQSFIATRADLDNGHFTGVPGPLPYVNSDDNDRWFDAPLGIGINAVSVVGNSFLFGLEVIGEGLGVVGQGLDEGASGVGLTRVLGMSPTEMAVAIPPLAPEARFLRRTPCSPAAESRLAGSARTVNPLNGTKNCVECARVMDARLSGVRGGTAPLSKPQPIANLGTDWVSVSGQAEIEQLLGNAGCGSRGIVYGSNPGELGHVWNVVNQRSGINFIDAQAGTGGAQWFQEYTKFLFLRTK
jgi:hypothetical protein